MLNFISEKGSKVAILIFHPGDPEDTEKAEMRFSVSSGSPGWIYENNKLYRNFCRCVLALSLSC